MTDHIVTSISGNILVIRINRPEKKNALSLSMYTVMGDALERAEANPQVRAIVLTGSGGCFTSGNDIADFLQSNPTGTESPAIRFLGKLGAAGKPVIAGVTGLAVGIGVTMLLHCDLVYAADTATFQLPFVNLGLVPEAASSMLLPRLMGHQRAAELVLLGERFDARTAHELGLVNAVVPASELAGIVDQRAAALAAKPPLSLRLTKALLKREPESISSRMAEEGKYFSRQLESPEAREAMEAFIERRKPDFSRFA
jgi:enoyl-CoA hydratase/carnithine racemase